MTETEPIKTLVVQRQDSITTTQLAETPGQTPNVVLTALKPWKIVLIRTARVFFQTLSGSATVASFTDVVSFKGAVLIAASAAVATAIQNTAELLAKWDQSFPEFRG